MNQQYSINLLVKHQSESSWIHFNIFHPFPTQNSELQAFRDQVEFMIGDNESIGDHIKRMLLEDKDTEVYGSESPLNLKPVQCYP